MKERVAKAVIRIFPRRFWPESNDYNFHLFIYLLFIIFEMIKLE